jgi:diacylglycerol O-acyltransferase / wax synthase
VAIMSYDGRMDFGLLGDYDAMPDLDALGEMLETSRAELVAMATQRGERRISTRERTSRPRTSSPATTGV